MGSGGALGLAFGGSLAAFMGVWGASLVVGAFGLLGMVVLTRVSLRAWARRVDGAKLKAALGRAPAFAYRHTSAGRRPLCAPSGELGGGDAG